MTKKKILAMILTVAMVLTLIPAMPVLAAVEQFTLPVGETYYVDLSSEAGAITDGVSDKIGTINTALPDETLNYVPFTYAGTINAYSLDNASSGVTASSYTASQNPTDHSLFVADYVVSHTVTWNKLAGLNDDGSGTMPAENLIFGTNYDTDYTLRSLSAGSINSIDGVIPSNNEWYVILGKNYGYIKNSSNIFSWGQDTNLTNDKNRVNLTLAWDWSPATSNLTNLGWRPALEVSNTLGADGLNAITLNLNGGHLGDDTAVTSMNIVYTDATYTAPDWASLTPPTEYNATGFKWNTAQDGSGDSYAPGESVPNTVTTLYAKWTANTYVISFNMNGGTGTANSMNVTYDSAVGTLPTLTRAGYTFGGWKIDGNDITSATVWNYAENKTAIAKWTAQTPTTDPVEDAKDAITGIPDISKINPDDKNALEDAKTKVDEAIKQVEALTDAQLEELKTQNPGIIGKLEDAYRDINYLLYGTLEILDITIGVEARGTMPKDANGNPIPVKLEVAEIADSTSLVSEVTEGFTGTPDIVLAFDVKLTADGKEVQPSGAIKVTFSAPGYEGKTLTVGHKKSDGEWQYFIVNVAADSTFSVNVTEFSPFIVLSNPELIPTGVTLSNTSVSLKSGEKTAITATVAPTTAVGDIAWISSNPAVATVDSNGVVTAVGTGTATITMSIGNVSASATVTVTSATSPETGDNANLALWVMVALVGAASLAVLMKKKFAK